MCTRSNFKLGPPKLGLGMRVHNIYVKFMLGRSVMVCLHSFVTRRQAKESRTLSTHSDLTSKLWKVSVHIQCMLLSVDPELITEQVNSNYYSVCEWTITNSLASVEHKTPAEFYSGIFRIPSQRLA